MNGDHFLGGCFGVALTILLLVVYSFGHDDGRSKVLREHRACREAVAADSLR